MTDPTDLTDEQADVLGEFLEELKASHDPPAVVARYSAAHPQWAGRFGRQAVLDRSFAAARPDDAAPDLTGLTDFRLLRRIGAGGMGVVYEAEQVSLGRRVALKVRHGRATAEREGAFEREQRTLAGLHQSHIVPIYQSGRCGGWQYFAMAFIDGASFHRVLRTAWELCAAGRPVLPLRPLVAEARRRERQAGDPGRTAAFADDLASHPTRLGLPDPAHPPPAARTSNPLRLSPEHFRAVAGVFADVAEAVAHAHAVGVVHRDLKPSNILLDLSGRAWLIDFGLAGESARPAAPAGTPGYIPPELLRVHTATVGPPVDVWALGVTLFEAVTLRRPFAGPHPDHPEWAVRALVPTAPPDLAAVCGKALRPAPGERYASARELADDLRRWLDGRPTVARPPTAWRAGGLWARRNKGWAAAIGFGVLLVLACGGLLGLWGWNQAEQARLRERSAEARAEADRETARLLERDAWLGEARRLAGGDHPNGWSDRGWDLVSRANTVRADESSRDAAVQTLRGWDAREVRYFPRGGSAVAFTPDGRGLVFGGVSAPVGKPPSAGTQAATWDGTADTTAVAGRAADGPVACGADGTAFQLTTDGDELVLADLHSGRQAWRVTAPADRLERAVGLSDRAEWVAASVRAGDRAVTRVWRATATDVWLEVDFAATAVAFSPPPKPNQPIEYVALADGRGRRVVVYALATKKAVAELPAGTVDVLSLCFGPNPKRTADPLSHFRLAGGDGGGLVTVWDVPARLPVAFLRGQSPGVFTIAFHPDGTLLAAGGRGPVRVWDVTAGTPLLSLSTAGGMDYVSQLAFSADGGRLTASSLGVYYPPCVVVWELRNGRGVRRLPGLSAQSEVIAVSADGETVAALGQNWELGVWDLASGHLRFLREVPPGAFADNAGLRFSPDGRTLAYSAGGVEAGVALLLDAATGAEVRRWSLPAGLENQLGFDGSDRLWHFQVETADGKALPSSLVDWRTNPRVGRLRNLKAADPVVTAEVVDFPRRVSRARMTPDGRHTLIEGDGAGRAVKVLDNAAGKVVATHLAQGDAGTSSLTIEAGGRWAWFQPVVDADPVRFPLPDGERRPLPLWTAAETAAGGYAVRTVHDDRGGCYLFRTGGHRPLATLSVGLLPFPPAFDPTGRRLFWSGSDGGVTVCDLDAVRGRLDTIGHGW